MHLNANDQSQGWNFSLSHQQAQKSMENRRKSEENEMQLKTGRKAWKISKTKISQTVRKPISQCENFANCSQTSFALRNPKSPVHCSFAKIALCEISHCENFAMPKSISQCQFQIRNANSNFAMRKFRNAKFRNAKIDFAMPIPISQCENFAIPNSQCENFAMRNFAMPKPISHCEIHCLCEIQFRKPFRIAKFTLRNLQALSSFVINAEPPSIFGVLLF